MSGNVRCKIEKPEFSEPRKLPYVSVQTRGKLPHLYREGGTYFITFRLNDAVSISNQNPKEPFSEIDFDKVCGDCEPPLQKGSCILQQESIAEIVQNALLFFHKERYYLYAWCIMPNHVHAVLTPYENQNVSAILHSWKSFTASKINNVLNRSGKVWEKESFDHLIRNKDHLERFISYTENNPVKAKLCYTANEWMFSSAGKTL